MGRPEALDSLPQKQVPRHRLVWISCVTCAVAGFASARLWDQNRISIDRAAAYAVLHDAELTTLRRQVQLSDEAAVAVQTAQQKMAEELRALSATLGPPLQRLRKLSRFKGAPGAHGMFARGVAPLALESLLAMANTREPWTGWVAAETSQGRLEDVLDHLRDLLSRTPLGWPVSGHISSSFGWRSDGYLGPGDHKGLDIATPYGNPVLASGQGTVVKAQWERGYGHTVEIEHAPGLTTRYAHLSAIHVRVGDRVNRGDRLGAVGMSGKSTGPHLHYEVLLGGRQINPYAFVKAAENQAAL